MLGTRPSMRKITYHSVEKRNLRMGDDKKKYAERERERRKAKVGKKTTENLYLLLCCESETEFRTETSVRKPSIRASYRHLGSYIWWSI